MNTNANTNSTVPTVTKKARGPYGPRKPKVIAKDESESEPALYTEPVEVVVAEEQEEESEESGTEKSVAEESGTEDADEEDDDESTISCVAEEEAEEEAEDAKHREEFPDHRICECECCIDCGCCECEKEEAEVPEFTPIIAVPMEEAEVPEFTPIIAVPMEEDQYHLQQEVLKGKAENIRLTRIIWKQQAEIKALQEGKTIPVSERKKAGVGEKRKREKKRGEDYAQQYIADNEILRWKHQGGAECLATYHKPDDKWTAKFNWETADEMDEEFVSLNAVTTKMKKHIPILGANAWTVFKTLDGKAVDKRA